jgi:hypothetical protein
MLRLRDWSLFFIEEKREKMEVGTDFLRIKDNK